MSFPLAFYLLALLSGAAATLLATPLWRIVCIRTGLVDDPGHRKIHDAPMPLAGGLAVFTGLLVPLGAGAAAIALGWLPPEASGALAYGLGRRAGQLAAIVGGACGMLALGILDDKYELKPAVKFAGQLAVAALVSAAGLRITLFVPGALFSHLATILWILTVTNAFNFMDNMNGLCAGLTTIAGWQFGIMAAMQGQYLAALFAFTATGALLGFLPHNFPRARAFLGDAGSHLAGFLMAVLAILPHFHTPEHPKPWAVLTPLLILAVPLGDLVSVVICRWKNGKPFYVGDTNHLSHRLARAGLGRTRTVLLIWLLAALLGGTAFLFP